MPNRNLMNANTNRALSFIKGYIESNKVAPTNKEIGEFLGFSSSAYVHTILSALEDRGMITRSRKWRGIEIVNG